MKRNQFRKLCLLLSIIGLGILYGSTTHLKPKITSIENIDSSKTGEVVQIQGNATSSYSTSKITFITLQDSTDQIQVIDFNTGRYSQGSNLTVLGKVELRQGDLQVVSTKIEQN